MKMHVPDLSKSNILHVEYSSPQDLSTWFEQHIIPHGPRSNKTCGSLWKTRDSYYGVQDHSTLFKYMKNGLSKSQWDEWGRFMGLEMDLWALYDKSLKKISKVVSERLLYQRSIKRDFVGHKVDMGAYLRGNPKNMKRRVKQEKPADILNIVVLNNSVCGDGPSRVYKMALIASIIMGLELHLDYKIDLSVGCLTNMYDQSNASNRVHDGYFLKYTSTHLKTPSEKISMFNHGFPLMTPAYQRMFDWSLREWLSYEKDTYLNPSYNIMKTNGIVYTTDTQGYNVVSTKWLESKYSKYIGLTEAMGGNSIAVNLEDFQYDFDPDDSFTSEEESEVISGYVDDFVKAINVAHAEERKDK